jgi:uncharacterized membrane protein SirB2
MSYLAVKHLHVTCVVLSGLGFGLRGMWMLTESPLLGTRWAKRVPHVIDSLLLGSAITLAVMSGQYPFVHGWLTAKVCGLLVYILCGAMALKRAKTKKARTVFLALALLSFVYIVSVALTKNPLPYVA